MPPSTDAGNNDAGEKPPQPQRTSPPTVLIVDDDISLRDVLKDTLEEEGFRVLVADDGAHALRLLRDAASPKPGVILLDHMMPVMDGPAFVTELRADETLASLTIPIVLLTADGRAAEKARTMGLTEYLRKPVKIEPLLSIVTRASSGGRTD